MQFNLKTLRNVMRSYIVKQQQHNSNNVNVSDEKLIKELLSFTETRQTIKKNLFILYHILGPYTEVTEDVYVRLINTLCEQRYGASPTHILYYIKDIL